ncbi:MAG: diacylglycerol kinase family lipid kinase [bacterium]|jgi:YegS/Rv2252/BmrU family lipid kinase|nr:diacylglycerol kinase family lipid kinase [candidate division KSB1 bacterium]MDH7561224.1 diacylglycerol kinase family lipid kinase [bacterium]
MPAFIIVNPKAANGRAGRIWPACARLLDEALGGQYEARLTEGPGHAVELAKEAAAHGYELVVAAGGDGTVNEVVNGLADALARTQLGILSLGTGKDLIKTLGIPADLRQAAQVLASGTVRHIDLGRALFVDHHGRRAERLFVNVGDVGFSGAVVQRVNRSSKALGGFVSYLGGLVATLVTYSNKLVHITVDQAVDEILVANAVVVANGQYFGGGMWVAPSAKADDGLFEVAVIGDVGKTEVIANVPRLYRGTLASHPKVRYFRGRTVTVNSGDEVLLDLDGEQPGRVPVTFELLPQALACLTPA